jgi:hypothetical protein
MKEVLGMEHFSLKKLSVEGLWGALIYWGPRKMLRNVPDTGISLHRGPFMSEGNLESGRGAQIPGTLNDE